MAARNLDRRPPTERDARNLDRLPGNTAGDAGEPKPQTPRGLGHTASLCKLHRSPGENPGTAQESFKGRQALHADTEPKETEQMSKPSAEEHRFAEHVTVRTRAAS